jgi:hypothetical protein
MCPRLARTVTGSFIGLEGIAFWVAQYQLTHRHRNESTLFLKFDTLFDHASLR